MTRGRVGEKSKTAGVKDGKERQRRGQSEREIEVEQTEVGCD